MLLCKHAILNKPLMTLLLFILESLVSGPLSSELQIKVYKTIMWDIIFKDIKFAFYIMGKIQAQIRC
jgi:hypothetical protein